MVDEILDCMEIIKGWVMLSKEGGCYDYGYFWCLLRSARDFANQLEQLQSRVRTQCL